VAENRIKQTLFGVREGRVNDAACCEMRDGKKVEVVACVRWEVWFAVSEVGEREVLKEDEVGKKEVLFHFVWPCGE
jgi:hypothetical protein